ncbi:hypothetical protein [Fervidicoccus fontis]|uniref:CARDB domain-containing protein n=1 Tax=Fervidicoccus fontis (strain DSM 19380 / JCM 18336 / VKM B-2539 / Kam940) TaxID=1163730 RepID=H9ZZH8_FERFK|nr:hypothetical protein [Fervidicoccus fontis]AFH42135.1 hypothetical protein FFONT_0143 [Fervidicoccus fontis Kam940]
MFYRKIFYLLSIIIIAASFAIIVSEAQTSEPTNTQINSINFVSSQNTPVYPGSKNAQLRIEVLFNVNASNAIGNLSSLPPGFSPSSNSGYSSAARDLYGNQVYFINASDVVYFEYYLNVNSDVSPGTYPIGFSLSYTINSTTRETDYFTIYVTVSQYPPLMVKVVSSQWNPAGYPGTQNTQLQITIENDGNSTINSAVASLSLPSGFVYTGGSIQIGTLQSNSRTTISFSGINIDKSLSPGNYTFSITLNALMSTQDGVGYDAQGTITFTVQVESIPSYYYELNLLSLKWGAASPQPVYENSRYVQLSATFLNTGQYPIFSVNGTANSEYFIPISNIDSYYGSISTGGTFTLSFYFDINSTSLSQLLSQNEVPVHFNVSYMINLGNNAYIVIFSNFTSFVGIENYVGVSNGTGVSLISSGWLSSYTVYPNTDNAIYTVQIANRLPFSINGINATLFLPSGFESNGCNYASAYYGTILQSYSSSTLQFKFNVGNIPPGIYNATLLVDYIANTGGPGSRLFNLFRVQLNITGESNTLEVVDSSFPLSSADTFSLGDQFRLTIRNLGYDSMNYPVLTVNLPPGITYSNTNTSVFSILPYTPSVSLPSQLTVQSLQAYYQQVLSSSQQSSTQQSGIQKGSTITFSFPLNINVNSTGIYTANATLSFVDAWGNIRNTSISFQIPVLGNIRYIDVKVFGSLDIRSRYTNMTVVICNYGSSPAYNVYVTLSPPSTITSGASSSLLLATPSVFYIKEIPPNSNVSFPVTFAFNPLGAQSFSGASTIINYGVAPLNIQISYEDPQGNSKSFTTSLALSIEPFIDIALTGGQAIYSSNDIKVTGTLINYGSSTAYRVEVVGSTGKQTSSYFVGDIDPSSQYAFRVDIPASQYVPIVNITISYYNAFNENINRTLQLSVINQQVNETSATTTTSTSEMPEEYIIALFIVAIFLLGAGYIIYRMYKTHQKDIEKRLPE